METFLEGYTTCALWSSTGDDELPLDGKYSKKDFAPEALKAMQEDCEAFERDNEDDLLEAGRDNRNGHDFWLTRNGHGAGFWDRGYGDVGDRLTEASKVYGESNLYIGDDNKVHVY